MCGHPTSIRPGGGCPTRKRRHAEGRPDGVGGPTGAPLGGPATGRTGIRFDLASAGEPAEACRRLLAAARGLDELGIDVLWVGERAGSALALCGAVAACTTRLRIATGVLPLPLHHPLRVAEDAATVDGISGGRLELGLGMGDDAERERGFGLGTDERRGRFEEGVDVLRRAWAHGPFDHQGEFHQFAGVEVHPKPVQDGGPPIWLGATSLAGADRAARAGVGLFTSRPEAAIRYLAAWREAGRDPGDARVAIELPWLLSVETPSQEAPSPTAGGLRIVSPQQARRESRALRDALDPAACVDLVLPGAAAGVSGDRLRRSARLLAENRPPAGPYIL